MHRFSRISLGGYIYMIHTKSNIKTNQFDKARGDFQISWTGIKTWCKYSWILYHSIIFALKSEQLFETLSNIWNGAAIKTFATSKITIAIVTILDKTDFTIPLKTHQSMQYWSKKISCGMIKRARNGWAKKFHKNKRS